MSTRGGYFLSVCVIAALTAPSPAADTATTFTYQCRGTSLGVPLEGLYAMRFSIWNCDTPGCAGEQQFGPTLVFDGHAPEFPMVTFSDGLATARLDFGMLTNMPNPAYIQIESCPNAGVVCAPNSFVFIGRQLMGPSPRAQDSVTAHTIIVPQFLSGSTSSGPLFRVTQTNGSNALAFEVVGTSQFSNTLTMSGATPFAITNGAAPLIQNLNAERLGGQMSGFYRDASNINSGVLPISRGGTGSMTQSFVDLSTAQAIGGAKTFNGTATFNAAASFAGPVTSSASSTAPISLIVNTGSGDALHAASSGGLAGYFLGDVSITGNSSFTGDATIDGRVGIGQAPAANSDLQVAGALYVQSVNNFIGVNRSNRIGAEYFGVRAPTTGTAYGGMYMETASATGKPFYGYANNGANHCWHYLDGSNGDWKLYNSGDRLFVTDGGLVGVGRSPTANPLEVEGNVASKTVAGSWAANSDARIKTDVRTVSGALELLDRVRLVDFRYTDEYRAAHPCIDDRHYLNVIAQEFAQVFPDYVRGSGETLPGAFCGDPGAEILQVDTYPLTIYAAAAVQELHASLNALADENAHLRSDNEELKAKIQDVTSDVAELKAQLAALRQSVATSKR